MRQISKKRARVLYREKKLIQELLVRCGGFCEMCNELPDWRGLRKHEKIHRSQGGDPLDPNNCLMACGRCHSGEHGIFEAFETELLQNPQIRREYKALKPKYDKIKQQLEKI